MQDVKVPEDWSQVAVDILVQKYFRKAGVPQDDRGNPLVDEAASRSPAARATPARCSTVSPAAGPTGAASHGYFSTPRTTPRLLRRDVLHARRQVAAPNSPQWFNTGLHWAYGIDGPAQGHFYVDPETGRSCQATSAYEHPQPHACFIQSVHDDLVNEGGIMDLWMREARLFKYGSGTGTNFSTLRGEGEPLSGGGRSSGLMSFLKIGDRAAGAIKSGGTTRRAAKMVCLDLDHPDIEEFITGRWSRSRRSRRWWPAPEPSRQA